MLADAGGDDHLAARQFVENLDGTLQRDLVAGCSVAQGEGLLLLVQLLQPGRKVELAVQPGLLDRSAG